MKTRGWRRLLWGVALTSHDERSILIGSLWHRYPGQTSYEGEPTRALLFCTRDQARQWCREREKSCAGRGDCCADWRFRAVKVVETVKVLR